MIFNYKVEEKGMRCKIKDISINYEAAGNGKPIIILHGYSLDHKAMTGCLEPIFKNNNNYKRIYVDLPGMGKSSSSGWISSSDVMLDVVIDFINKIIPNENFLLAGHSYGGYLSRGVVYKIPDRIDGLFLLCPVIISDIKKRNNPSHTVLVRDEKLLSQLKPSEARLFDSTHVVQNKNIWERFRSEILSGIKLSDQKFLHNLQKKGYGFSFDVDKLSKKFDKPTLILLGHQDSTVGYKDAWSILDNYPRAAFAVLDRAGHHLQIEQENLFNSLVSEWLTRVNDSLI